MTPSLPSAPAFPPTRDVRYHSLDFWRGVACLSVVVFHSTFYVATPALDQQARTGAGLTAAEWAVLATSRLWLGVPIFFVISGYCIAASADLQRARGRPAGRFFVRRFRRIYPPLWAFLALFVAVAAPLEWLVPGTLADSVHGIPPPWANSTWQWLGGLTLTESWRHHLVGDGRQYVVGHLWTLCYEEQFYLVVGLVLLVCPRRLFAGLAAVTLGVVLFVTLGRSAEPGWNGFFFDGRWLLFAVGLAVYYALNHTSSRGRVVTALAFAAGLAVACRKPAPLTAFEATGEAGLAAALAFGLVLLALAPLDRALAGARWARPISWCGVMCYSLYLVHWPIAKVVSHAAFLVGLTGPVPTLLVTVPVCLAASLAAGWLFHATVERRFWNVQPDRSAAEAKPVVIAARVAEPAFERVPQYTSVQRSRSRSE
jgi:peptidoglycan/LPS O-acetylase OafA/YrhL